MSPHCATAVSPVTCHHIIPQLSPQWHVTTLYHSCLPSDMSPHCTTTVYPSDMSPHCTTAVYASDVSPHCTTTVSPVACHHLVPPLSTPVTCSFFPYACSTIPWLRWNTSTDWFHSSQTIGTRYVRGFTLLVAATTESGGCSGQTHVRVQTNLCCVNIHH